MGSALADPLKPLYEAVLNKGVLRACTWKEAVDAFAFVAGQDMYDPADDALMKLSRGEVIQRKDESIVEYTVRFRRITVSLPDGVSFPDRLLCDKYIAGMNNAQMRRQCATPIFGGKWDDLQKCTEFAVACEKRCIGPVLTNAAMAGEPRTEGVQSANAIFDNARGRQQKRFMRGHGRFQAGLGRGRPEGRRRQAQGSWPKPWW